MRAAAVSLALCLGDVSGAAHAGVAKGDLVPKLENVASDKKFFGPPFPADYPDDMHPGTGHSLNPTKHQAIYPSLNNGLSDHDFVKDENSDGGEWEAQMSYDNSRVKYTKNRQLSEKAQDRLKKEAQEAKEAREKERTAQSAEDVAEKAEKVSKQDEKSAVDAEQALKDKAAKAKTEYDRKVKEYEVWKQSKATIDKAVEESATVLKAAQDVFDKAEEGLKGCKENLAKAKGKLAKAQHETDAQKQRQAIEKQESDSLHSKKADVVGSSASLKSGTNYEEKLAAAKANAKAKAAESKAAKVKEDALSEEEKSLQAKADMELKEEHAVEDEAAKMQKRSDAAKKELDEAKQRLRNIRNPAPSEVKSGAAEFASPFLVMLVAACASLMF